MIEALRQAFPAFSQTHADDCELRAPEGEPGRFGLGERTGGSLGDIVRVEYGDVALERAARTEVLYSGEIRSLPPSERSRLSSLFLADLERVARECAQHPRTLGPGAMPVTTPMSERERQCQRTEIESFTLDMAWRDVE